MFNCDSLLIDTIIEKSKPKLKPCLVLVESEKHGLGLTLNCGDHACEVCNTPIGRIARVSSDLSLLLFGKRKEKRIKIVARIENV